MKRLFFHTRRRGLTALLCIAATMFAACGSGERRFVIGVAQCSEDSWRAKLNEELLTATYLYDNVNIEFASADDDDDRQIEQINDFVGQGVDLLIVSPNQMNRISDAIDKAYDSGIPVILLDRKTGSGKYTAFIGADNVDIGRSIGEFVAAALGGHGRVVEIQGLAGSSPAIDRHRGFMEAIGRHPGIEVADSRCADWLQPGGQAVMDSVLDALPTGSDDIDCVFGHNDRMAVGAYEAIRRRGGGKGVIFAGVDALPTKDGGIARVQDGTLTVSCIYPTRGDLVIRLAMDILEGRPYKKENTLKAALVTRDNADVMMIQAEELDGQNRYLATLHAKVDTYLAQYNHQKVYLMLVIIIVVLLVVFFVMAYRIVITKRRVAEETANAKLVFFTNMSHEFRTPLTLIADPVERMLGDDNLTPRQHERLTMVSRNARVLLRLVSEILEFRRLQNGKMTLSLSRFDLSENLRGWAGGFSPTAEARGIGISVKAAPGIIIHSDLYKVERICYNLMSNAVKYTRTGGSVTVEAAREGADVRISVSDTGIGIPKDKVGRVFDRFFQVKSNPVGGTGIGLALVKAFAETLHGSVSVVSEEGRGSTFTVVLPAEQPGTDPADDAAMTRNDGGTQTGGMEGQQGNAAETLARMDGVSDERRPTVLITDDNDDIRAYIASLLDDRYNVIFAADGREGLDKAVRCVPDVVVCDVMMPVMDGLEMCRRIKSETATSHIPVLMLTARSLEEQQAEGYDCGADGYLTKPFNGNVLVSRIGNLLEGRRRLRELFNSEYTAKTESNGNEASAAPGASKADVLFVSKFREKVRERMTDPDLSVETLGADMNLSRVQLYRKVKALTGSTPVEIIRRSRLDKAKELLGEGGKTVAEVAYEVGFSSPSYFIKCYKDLFGHTPNSRT